MGACTGAFGLLPQFFVLSPPSLPPQMWVKSRKMGIFLYTVVKTDDFWGSCQVAPPEKMTHFSLAIYINFLKPNTFSMWSNRLIACMYIFAVCVIAHECLSYKVKCIIVRILLWQYKCWQLFVRLFVICIFPYNIL